jgi:hypothetical protein
MIETEKMICVQRPPNSTHVFKENSEKLEIGISSILIAFFVSIVMFVTKYYFESDILILSLIVVSFLFVLSGKITIVQFCLMFLPFNTSTATFGNSVMVYCLVFGLLYTMQKHGASIVPKVHLNFSFWLMFFLTLIGIKNIIIYSLFRDLTFIISVVMIGIIIKKNVRYDALINEFFPYGIVIITFGILQLLTGKGVGIRYVGSVITTQLSGTYEPNYYTLYLNTFLSVVLFTKTRINGIIKASIIIATVALILLVRSNTGMLGLLSISMIKLLSGLTTNNQKKIIKLLIIIILGIIGLLVVHDIVISTINNSRLVQTIMGFLSTGDVNKFTTGRVEIWSQYFQYFRQQSLIEKLIGSSLSLFRENYGIFKYTHNFWVDVLIETGMIGFIFYLISLVILYSRYFKNRRKELSQFFGLAILAIFFLYSLTLSLYTERTSWTMAILLLYQTRSRRSSLNMKYGYSWLDK